MRRCFLNLCLLVSLICSLPPANSPANDEAGGREAKPAASEALSSRLLQERLRLYLNSPANPHREKAAQLVDLNRITLEIPSNRGDRPNVPVRIHYELRPGAPDSTEVEQLVERMVLDFLSRKILDKSSPQASSDRKGPKGQSKPAAASVPRPPAKPDVPPIALSGPRLFAPGMEPSLSLGGQTVTAQKIALPKRATSMTAPPKQPATAFGADKRRTPETPATAAPLARLAKNGPAHLPRTSQPMPIRRETALLAPPKNLTTQTAAKSAKAAAPPTTLAIRRALPASEPVTKPLKAPQVPALVEPPPKLPKRPATPSRSSATIRKPSPQATALRRALAKPGFAAKPTLTAERALPTKAGANRAVVSSKLAKFTAPAAPRPASVPTQLIRVQNSAAHSVPASRKPPAIAPKEIAVASKDIEERLRPDHELFAELGYSAAIPPASTPETWFDMAYACYVRGWYREAIAQAERGLAVRDDARLQLIKGVCQLHAGRDFDAESTAHAYQAAVARGRTTGLSTALEHINDVMSVKFLALQAHGTLARKRD